MKLKGKLKKFLKNKDIKNIIFMLGFSFIFLFAWANKEKLYPENIILYFQSKMSSLSFKNNFPVNIYGNINGFENIKFMGDTQAILSDISFDVIDNNGNLIRSVKHNLKNPKYKTGQVRTILYDVGGKEYSIESAVKNLHKAVSDENIISCDISENGGYALITESHEYMCKLVFYNSKNEEKYKYYFSDCYATDVCLKKDAQGGYVSGISFEDGKINSNIYSLDFKSEKPKSIFKIEDNLVSSLYSFSNGNIVAIGDKYISVINPSSGHIKNYEFNNKNLKSYSFSREYGLVCLLSCSNGNGQDDEIVVIDNFGKSGNAITTNEDIKSISHYKNRIFCLSNTKILVYNTCGIFEGYTNLENIFNSIFAVNDSNAYLVADKSIEKIKIKNLKK